MMLQICNCPFGRIKVPHPSLALSQHRVFQTENRNSHGPGVSCLVCPRYSQHSSSKNHTPNLHHPHNLITSPQSPFPLISFPVQQTKKKQSRLTQKAAKQNMWSISLCDFSSQPQTQNTQRASLTSCLELLFLTVNDSSDVPGFVCQALPQ